MSSEEKIYKAINNPDYMSEVAKGNVTGHSPYIIWGLNSNISSGTAWIWEAVQDHVWQSQEENIVLVSDSPNDTNGGTGWNICSVRGLDGEFNKISEYVTLDGLTPVKTTKKFLHVSKIDASFGDSKVGSLDVNDGKITATFDGTTDVSTVVMPKQGVNVHLFDIVPAGVSLMVNKFKFVVFQVNPGLEAFITITPWVHPIGHGKQIVAPDIIDTDKENKIQDRLVPPFRIPEKTRWWIEVETNRDETKVSGQISGMYVKNKDINI